MVEFILSSIPNIPNIPIKINIKLNLIFIIIIVLISLQISTEAFANAFHVENRKSKQLNKCLGNYKFQSLNKKLIGNWHGGINKEDEDLFIVGTIGNLFQ